MVDHPDRTAGGGRGLLARQRHRPRRFAPLEASSSSFCSMTPWDALPELLIVAGIYVADLFGFIPLSNTPFLLAVAWTSLRRRGLTWRDVGLVRPNSWPRALALGAAAGCA